MDFRVRIILLLVPYLYLSEGLNSIEEIPPSLQEQSKTVPMSSSPQYLNLTASFVSTSVNTTAIPRIVKNSVVWAKETKQTSPSIKSVGAVRQVPTMPSAAAPEFEDRNESDEGGKGDERLDATLNDGTNVTPPADNEAAGEGVAKEDTEPVEDKDKENQLGALVEDAKGNVATPRSSLKFQSRIDFDQSGDSHFMTVIVMGGMLLFCLYLVHHNKKKILGLIFEGRVSAHSRRNVRYRRLSQREEHDKEIIAH